MQHIVIGPPGLIIIVDVLWKSAHIHHPEMTADIRPLIRRGLTTVIEPRPNKSTYPPRPLRRQWPPLLRRICPPRRGHILIRHITSHRILFIDAPRRDRAPHLRSKDRLIRMVLMIGIDPLYPIIKSPNRDHLVDPL